MANETTLFLDPTLFLFLGSTPGKVGYRVKQQLQTAYGDLPIFKFLWVDTDQNVDDPAARQAFTRNERAELAGFDADAVIAHLANWPQIKSWWPQDGSLKPGHISDGAHQIRLIGRLALFRMFNEPSPDGTPSLYGKLDSALKSIHQINSALETQQSCAPGLKYQVRQGRVRVVVVFSTCGGSGSGIVFDMVYLCHHLLSGIPHSVTGFAILPQVIQNDMQRGQENMVHKTSANSYAWFKDHEYLLHNPVWSAEYPGKLRLRVSDTPFDRLFVFDIGNQHNQLLNQGQDVCQMIANAIFLNSGQTSAELISSLTDNASRISLLPDHKRYTAYSSLAVASRIYPKRRLLDYCAARLVHDLLEVGLATDVEPQAAQEVSQEIIRRLDVEEARLFETLSAGDQLHHEYIDEVSSAPNVGKSVEYLLAQEREDAAELQQLHSDIAFKALQVRKSCTEQLKEAMGRVALERGIAFAEKVRANLEATWASGSRNNGELEQKDLEKKHKSYAEAKKRLGAMEGDLLISVVELLYRKQWDKATTKARNDCIQARDEINKATLKLYTRQAAADVYTGLMAEAVNLKNQLVVLGQELRNTANEMEHSANHALQPATPKEGVYELAREAVDADYFRWYYQSKRPHDLNASLQKLIQGLLDEKMLDDLLLWKVETIQRRLLEYTRQEFQPTLESSSLLRALQEYHGEEAPVHIQTLFDDLAQFCSPFWRFNRNLGVQPESSLAVIGVPSQDIALIPAPYQDAHSFYITPTQNLERIDLMLVQHNLPAFVLHGMAQWKADYDKEMESGADPQHVIRAAEWFEEVIPEENEQARQAFAVAMALGYINRAAGDWYYDPQRKIGKKNAAPPLQQYRLAEVKQRSEAEEIFILHEDWVRQVNELIRNEILKTGDTAAARKLQAQIDKLEKEKQANLNQRLLRRQLEKEIRALQNKLDTLVQ